MMDMDFFDRFSRLDSPVHRLSAAAKLVAALVMIVGVVTVPMRGAVWLVVPLVLLLAVTVLSRLPVRWLVRRLALLEPFVLGAAALALFQPGGWRLFLLLAGKCTLCLWTAVVLANTTPFAELLAVLRRARVPGLLVTTLALMYRYLFVIADEARRMKRARMSRTFAARRGVQWRVLATVAGQLFVRSSERAERIYAAMCARGWR